MMLAILAHGVDLTAWYAFGTGSGPVVRLVTSHRPNAVAIVGWVVTRRLLRQEGHKVIWNSSLRTSRRDLRGWRKLLIGLARSFFDLREKR